jgi:hypothetical protein
LYGIDVVAWLVDDVRRPHMLYSASIEQIKADYDACCAAEAEEAALRSRTSADPSVPLKFFI